MRRDLGLVAPNSENVQGAVGVANVSWLAPYDLIVVGIRAVLSTDANVANRTLSLTVTTDILAGAGATFDVEGLADVVASSAATWNLWPGQTASAGDGRQWSSPIPAMRLRGGKGEVSLGGNLIQAGDQLSLTVMTAPI